MTIAIAAAIAATPTTAAIPYVETTITSTDLHTLKVYVAAATTPTLLVNLDYIGATAKTLSTSMAEDDAIAHAAWAAATGITIQSEFALVQ